MNVIDSIEEIVGKLWQTLSVEGPLDESKIINEIKINNNLFYGAVGWLARENKIQKINSNYLLGTTNLTEKVGADAGKVWLVLDTWGEVDALSISKLARINENDVFLAIGWLAREGKIEGKIIDNKENKIKFWLK